MFCVWNKFTNREGQLYGFFSSLCLFLRGGICHARSKTPGSRIKCGMTGELYFSELYVLSGGYLLPLWFYVSFYSPFYLPFCIVDFQVFIVVICLFICNYLPFYSPFTNYSSPFSSRAFSPMFKALAIISFCFLYFSPSI